MLRDFIVMFVNLKNTRRVYFPIQNNRSSFPFHLVHTYIWDPSRVPNETGSRWFVSFIDDYTQCFKNRT